MVDNVNGGGGANNSATATPTASKLPPKPANLTITRDCVYCGENTDGKTFHEITCEDNPLPYTGKYANG